VAEGTVEEEMAIHHKRLIDRRDARKLQLQQKYEEGGGNRGKQI
jgi:hypothetical protein